MMLDSVIKICVSGTPWITKGFTISESGNLIFYLPFEMMKNFANYHSKLQPSCANKYVGQSVFFWSDFIQRSFFRRANLLWNALPQAIQNEIQFARTNCIYEKIIGSYFTGKFVIKFENPQFGRKCWQDYHFK